MPSPQPREDESAPLLSSDDASTLGPPSSDVSLRSQSPPPSTRRRSQNIIRTVSFVSAIICSLCGGSIQSFSLYGHIFQERLHYSQFHINGVAIGSSIALYLPVSFLGYLCDRVGPAPLSLLSAGLFGAGYGLAAGIYRKAATASAARGHGSGHGSGHGDWTYPLMIVAFLCIGVASCCMYLAAVATCAKNFGKGKHRGLALAAPIAAFGLSGMWLSQFGSRVLYERLPDGGKGDVDVFKFFLFLAILLFVVGVLSSFTLRVVDEQDFIDEAVEEMERSGFLDGSAILTPGRTAHGYGATEQRNPLDEESDAGILDPSKDDEDDEDAKLRKTWLLNAETRRFLGDRTMWLLALGFFFMIGPGEAFINNLGTVIQTLYPPAKHFSGPPTSPATHVSIVGVTSTVMRLLTGSLTDILAPSPHTRHVQIASSSSSIRDSRRWSVSRVAFLLFFGIVLSLGMVVLASGFIQDHGERFWLVSGLVGAGYGAVFSLTPIIITVIWGVENFATNWGIVAMFPALGSTLWGLIYSAVYQAGAESSAPPPGEEDGGDIFCYGKQCYASTFWGMAASVWIALALVLWAWKGRNGWAQSRIVV